MENLEDFKKEYFKELGAISYQIVKPKQCTCPCHTSDMITLHAFPCCDETYKKFK